MLSEIDWPWLVVDDEDETIKGVVWKFAGDIEVADDFDESGLVIYEIEFDERSKPENFNWEKFEAYTQSYILRAIQNGIESVGLASKDA